MVQTWETQELWKGQCKSQEGSQRHTERPVLYQSLHLSFITVLNTIMIIIPILQMKNLVQGQRDLKQHGATWPTSVPCPGVPPTGAPAHRTTEQGGGSEFSRGRGYIHIDRPPVSFILYTDFLKGDLASGPDFTVDQLLHS